MQQSITQLYLDWIYALVFPKPSEGLYHRLCRRLYHTDFRFSIPMDMNRESDGIELRYRFAYENSLDRRIVAHELDNRPCSVLEMMAALALRCEEGVMGDPGKGNQTGRWFWEMIVSMGLDTMTDDHYVERHVDNVVRRMLDRKYPANGRGGLFTIRQSQRDMRKAEIWYQMCWRMDELLHRMEDL